MTTMVASFMALLLCQVTPMTRIVFNNIPAGPFAIMFAMAYQYTRLVPPAYHFRVFGLGMSDKIWVYAIALQVCVDRKHFRSLQRQYHACRANHMVVCRAEPYGRAMNVERGLRGCSVDVGSSSPCASSSSRDKRTSGQQLTAIHPLPYSSPQPVYPQRCSRPR